MTLEHLHTSPPHFTSTLQGTPPHFTPRHQRAVLTCIWLMTLSTAQSHLSFGFLGHLISFFRSMGGGAGVSSSKLVLLSSPRAGVVASWGGIEDVVVVMAGPSVVVVVVEMVANGMVSEAWASPGAKPDAATAAAEEAVGVLPLVTCRR